MGPVWSLAYAGQLKLKLYRDENGELKGDGRCCYLKVGGRGWEVLLPQGGWEGMGGAATSRWVGGDGRCCYLKVGGRGWEVLLPQGGWDGMGGAATSRWVGRDGRCCYLKVGGMGWEGMGRVEMGRNGRCCYLKVGGRGCGKDTPLLFLPLMLRESQWTWRFSC